MAFKKFTSSEEMLKPDPRHNSKLVSKFINCLMWDGKKAIAQKIVYGAFDNIGKKVKDVPVLEVFHLINTRQTAAWFLDELIDRRHTLHGSLSTDPVDYSGSLANRRGNASGHAAAHNTLPAKKEAGEYRPSRRGLQGQATRGRRASADLTEPGPRAMIFSHGVDPRV